VTCLLKARIVKPAETIVARQWLSGSHAKAATQHSTVGELLEAVFSVRSVPSLYNEDQPVSTRRVRVESLETVERVFRQTVS
jgi:hypothetical protein